MLKRGVRKCVAPSRDTLRATDELGLAQGNALDGDQDEEEEDGQDGEAFCGACLGADVISIATICCER